MDPITSLVLILGVLAVIAIIAIIAGHTGDTTPHADDVRIEIGGAICHFTPDDWQSICANLTAAELAAIERLDAARDALHTAERSGNATQVANAERHFNACFEPVHTTYQRVALAWFATPQGQHWLALRRLPQKTH